MKRPPCDHPFASVRVNSVEDFDPELDVPSAGRAATEALLADIEAVRARPDPDPARRIHLLSGAPGYGKTHLFGRVRHRLGDRVQFVFVPAPPDPGRPVENAAWRVVEALFESGHGLAPLRTHLSRVLAPSFAAYFDQLPAGLRAAAAAPPLADDPLGVLQVFAPVADLAPYHVLADSLCRRLATVPRGVVRAMVLGLSPAADDAKTWLRGEADQLPADRLAALRLGPASPCAAEVVLGAAEVLRLAGVPMALCFDQLDVLHVQSRDGFRDLTAQAMGWLQTVPNLVVVLGCVDTAWATITKEDNIKSFLDRVATHPLSPLTADEAAEVVTRRVRAWDEFEPGRPAGWPFDLAAVRRFASEKPTPPRGFIKECCTPAFDEWRAGGRKGLVQLGGPPPPRSLGELFEQEWAKELAATRAAAKPANDYQDAELWAGVWNAAEVARLGKHLPAGVELNKISTQALAKTPSDSRPSAELHLGVGAARASVVVAVSKKDSGAAFAAWVGALEKAVGGHVAGAVVVWPKAQLAVGKTTAGYKKYEARVSAKTVRPFPLDENADTFAHLECLRRLVNRAEARDLTLGGQAVDAPTCRALAAGTKVLEKLKLFEFLFENWPAVEEARKAPAQVAKTAQPPAAPPVPVPPAPPTGGAAATQQGATAVADPPKPPLVPPVPLPTPPDSDWAGRMLATVVERLHSRGQTVHPAGAEVGPTFVRLKLELKGDADFGRIKKQVDNLKMQLGLDAKPLIASQAGYVSVDIRRPDRQTVAMAPLLAARPAHLAGRPAFCAGVDVAGRAHWVDLSDPANCHLLVAGTTGSGKSEFLKSALAGLAAGLAPEALRLFLVDPKQVTFNLPGDSPYLAEPVVLDAAEAVPVLERCTAEMGRRYALLRTRGKEHVGELAGSDAQARWVVVIDEFADLMTDKATKKELEAQLRRLGGMARAAGIHLVLGTQRPEASVVTPLLRSNLPGRVGLQVATERDAKLVLDDPDAAYLLGKGDLLLRRGGGLTRLQSPFVAKPELEKLLRVG